MYQTQYERDSHTHTVSSVTIRNAPVLSSPYRRDTDTNTIGPVSDMSCVQLCKDPYHMTIPSNTDWSGDNCHNYCGYDMEVCIAVNHLDIPLSAINAKPVYGQHGLASPNGVVILFDAPDCNGVSRIIWNYDSDLSNIGFNDRAQSYLVMPPGSVPQPSKREVDIGSTQV